MFWFYLCLGMVILAALLLTAGVYIWVYQDAKERGERAWLWVLIILTRNNNCLDRLTPQRIRYADHTAFYNGRMLHQHIFHFIRSNPEAACLDDIIKTSMEPVMAMFIHICRITRMIYPITPDISVLFIIV